MGHSLSQLARGAIRLRTALIALLILFSGSVGAQVITEFSDGITAVAGHSGITIGPDGNLWFTEQQGNRIGRITPPGVVTEFSSVITAFREPSRHHRRPRRQPLVHGAVRQPNRADYPAGHVTEFRSGISAGASPDGITAGPDGNLWFTEISRPDRADYAGGTSPSSAPAHPRRGTFGITAGPDGNLWFTESLTTTGSADDPERHRHRVQHRLTAGGSSGITAGPDGNLWFTEPTATDRADHPARRRHRVQRRHHRRRVPEALPQAPMATCGSRNSSLQPDLADYPKRHRHRVQRRHQHQCGTFWHYGRTRWQPVVHGTCSSHRAHYHGPSATTVPVDRRLAQGTWCRRHVRSAAYGGHSAGSTKPDDRAANQTDGDRCVDLRRGHRRRDRRVDRRHRDLAAVTFSGNDVIVPLNGVIDQQYVTISATMV